MTPEEMEALGKRAREVSTTLAQQRQQLDHYVSEAERLFFHLGFRYAEIPFVKGFVFGYGQMGQEWSLYVRPQTPCGEPHRLREYEHHLIGQTVNYWPVLEKALRASCANE